MLILASTGIALNHSDRWSLDQQFVSATWLLNAYGVDAPPPGASFVDDGHRATLLGQRLYLDGKEIAQNFDSLTGIVALEQFVLVTSDNDGMIMTRKGEFVETIELVPTSETVVKVGRVGQRPVTQSTLAYYIGDEEVTAFESAAPNAWNAVVWSEASPPPASELRELERLYRGRGVTVERVISDFHSGRIVGITGTFLMDVVAVFLILLSLTGLAVWLLPKSRPNRADNNTRVK